MSDVTESVARDLSPSDMDDVEAWLWNHVGDRLIAPQFARLLAAFKVRGQTIARLTALLREQYDLAHNIGTAQTRTVGTRDGGDEGCDDRCRNALAALEGSR